MATSEYIFSMQIDLCLYQPDIAGNLGTSIRTAACLGIKHLHIIMPMAFPFDDKAFKRSMLDYVSGLNLEKHMDFATFCSKVKDRRLVLLTTKANVCYTDFSYQAGDILIAGSESRGVSSVAMDMIPHHVRIPMVQDKRSLNVAVSIGMALGEIGRQLGFCGT